MRGSSLPVRAVRVHAYICVCTYGGDAYAKSSEKKGGIFTGENEKSGTLAERDSRARLPPHLLVRLVG